MLSGYSAIPHLIASYAKYLDSGKFKEASALFVNATIKVDSGEAVPGEASVLASEGKTRLYGADRMPLTKHVTTNLLLEVDDDAGTATCGSYVTVYQTIPAMPLSVIYAGEYDDRFQRLDGIWQFASRHVLSDFVGDMSGHVVS